MSLLANVGLFNNAGALLLDRVEIAGTGNTIDIYMSSTSNLLNVVPDRSCFDFDRYLGYKDISTVTVDTVARKITLNLSCSLFKGDQPIVYYTQPATSAIQNQQGKKLASFSALASNLLTVQGPENITSATTKLWIKSRTEANKTMFGKSITSRQVGNFVSDDANAVAFTAVTGANRDRMQICNGKWLYILNNCKYDHATPAYWNFLKDGTAWEMWFKSDFMLASNSRFTVLSNNNNTSTNIGISIAYDNRTSASRTNALSVAVSKAGTVIYNLVINNFFTPGTFTLCRLVFDGSTANGGTGTLRAFKNGTLAGSVVASSTFDTTNPATLNMSLNDQPNAAAPSNRERRKDIILFQGNLSAGDATILTDYFSRGSDLGGARGDLDIIKLKGQSNIAGSSSSIPAELTGPIPPILSFHSETVIKRYTDIFEFNYNSNFATTPGTQKHGPSIKLAQLLSTTRPKTLIFSNGFGGTSLFRQPNNLGNTWNVADTGSLGQDHVSYLVSLIKYDLPFAADYTGTLKHQHWGQGERDSGADVDFAATSTTSVTIATGSVSMTISVGKPYVATQPILIDAGSGNTMSGTVTSYNYSTGALVANITSVTGSGTFASWTINITDPQYKDNLYAMIRYDIDQLKANGIPVNKMNWSFQGMQTFSPSKTFRTSVDSAIQYTVANFKTENPTYAADIPGMFYIDTTSLTLEDGLHFDPLLANGMTQYATLIYNCYNTNYIA